MNTSLNFKLLCAASFLAAAIHMNAQTAVYYADPVNGADTNAGTFDKPFKTIAKGVAAIKTAGSTLMLRGGTYAVAAKISLGSTASDTSRIRIWAYPGEKPVFDCSAVTTSDGISISGSYYHLRGIEVTLAGHNGINISGGHNIVENCTVDRNKNTGLQMTGGANNNLILNCDSYLNYDPPIGGNADGFGAKWDIGTGNVYKGCRSYNNSDDGWDLWMAANPVVIDSCFAFRNGVNYWGDPQFNGNGNGFKLGGNYVATPNTVRNCVSFDNAGGGGKGFDENHNLAGQTLYNCTAFRNKGKNFSFPDSLQTGVHVIKNCLSVSGSVSILNGATLQANSWQGIAVSTADFISIDTTLAVAPRNADGSLADNNFLRLASGSKLIDAGVDVGIPFKGKSPDIGAFESGTSTDVRASADAPQSFMLEQNFPNPFNPSTTIRYSVAGTQPVRLSVFDELGREVAVLVNEVETPGEYSATWDARSYASGIYFYRLSVAGAQGTQAARLSQTRMLVLQK